MTNFDPCLAGCEDALAEADRLLAVLAATDSDNAALAPVRASITRLRREVDRLRGLQVAPARRKTGPMWTQSTTGQSPWAPGTTPLPDPV